MAKQNNGYLHQRGDIQESAVKALVTDPLFKMRVEKNRKGKGSYRRNEKHKKHYMLKEKPHIK
ncbi:alternative ribosome-rescue factor A, partial [Mannheimia indoligenes]|uniref:alternative ribosome-rescue factor A n=1 Tax=Mannheimia indoligenes TaxID=3103145 RepID=UPI003D1676FC